MGAPLVAGAQRVHRGRREVLGRNVHLNKILRISFMVFCCIIIFVVLTQIIHNVLLGAIGADLTDG